MTPTIDAHHHFWRYSTAEYGWISDDMRAIRRDFLPSDLEAELRPTGIGGVVSVQVRQALEETEDLLAFARQSRFVRGVVGWVPLAAPDAEAHLDRFAGQPLLRGVRHVVQREPDGFLAGQAFGRGVSLLESRGLVYDLLVYERQLAEAVHFVDRHPRQVFVLDHIAKPRIRDHALEPWTHEIRRLAERPNVFCKVSGMVTEADFVSWREDHLRPYWDVVLEAFGPRRLMFGSDWPVCLVACGYARWHELVRGWASRLSVDEREALFGGTACRAYGLRVEDSR
jgi:L-fuconolactonase